MSDADKTVEYAITADPTGFAAGMAAAQAAAQETAASFKESFAAIDEQMTALGEAFEHVTAMLGALTAIAAGGEAFKEVLEKSSAWALSAEKLSKQLGVTTEQASVLMVATRGLGLDSGLVATAASKMTTQIHNNAEAFETLGVKVKDANGQYRPTMDIMGEVNEKLLAIKNPVEQNIAGMQVYGRAWTELRPILRLTTESLEESKQKAIDLGLVVGEEGVAQARKYEEAMNDMGLVMTSLEVQMGSALMPAFVRIGAWLSSIGPGAGKVMGLVMDSLGNIMTTLGETVMAVWGVVRSVFSGIGDLVAQVFGGKGPSAMELFIDTLQVVQVMVVGFKVAVQMALEGVSVMLEVLGANFVRLGSVIERLFHLDLAGAIAAWKTGGKMMDGIILEHMHNVVKITQEGKDKMDEILTRPPKAEPTIKEKDTSGGPNPDFSKDSDKKAQSRMQEWQAKLAADKDGFAQEQDQANTAHQYSIAREAAYWKNILDTVTMSKEEQNQVEIKYTALHLKIQQEAFDAEIARQKAGMEAFKNDHAAREQIALKIYEEEKGRYGEGSKQAIAADAEVQKEKRAGIAQTLAVEKVAQEAERTRELAAIDQAEQDARERVANHQMTGEQLLELQKQLEDKRYQIKLQALQAEQALLKGTDQDPVAIAKMNVQIETLEQQHQAKLAAIRKTAATEQQKLMTTMYGSIESGMTNVVNGTLNGTIKMSNVLQSMMQVVSKAVIDMIAQTAEKWIANLVMTQIGSKTSAISQISANAGVAGSAAMASAAAIPFTGWAMAPEAGAAVSAAAMAFMPMASAMGGYDIPAGLNPIVQTHAQEMILPAKYADVIRSMANAGSGSGAGSSGHTINYHDYSGSLTHADIRKNVGVIAKALNDYAKKS